MVNAPCKDCPDRYLGCHSSCPKYIEFRKEKDAENKQMSRDKQSHVKLRSDSV